MTRTARPLGLGLPTVVCLLLAPAYAIAMALTRDPLLFALLGPATVVFLVLLGLSRMRSPRRIAAVLLGGAWLVVAGFILNRRCLPVMTTPIGLTGNAVHLAFTAFLVWCLVQRGRLRRLALGFAILIPVVGLLRLGASITSETTHVSTTDAIASLPYVTYVSKDEAPSRGGVTVHDPQRCWPGLNLYRSFEMPDAQLLDMDGRAVRVWQPAKPYPPRWHYDRLLPGGDLLTCIRDIALLRQDRDSRVVWERRIRAHHDMDVAPDGVIRTVARRDEVVDIDGVPTPIVNDYLVRLAPDGEIVEERALFPVYEAFIPRDRIWRTYAWVLDPRNLWSLLACRRDFGFSLQSSTAHDVFHTNNVTVLHRDVPGFCREGDLLISSPMLNLIGVLDPERWELVWSWGPGVLERQHHPSLLENGHLLVFDNGGVERPYSRVLEIDPTTKGVVWRYRADPLEDFFSVWGGAAQRLPNGNTLITESDKGRVFEVTAAGEIVWEFLNPEHDAASGRRATIYRMLRVSDADGALF